MYALRDGWWTVKKRVCQPLSRALCYNSFRDLKVEISVELQFTVDALTAGFLSDLAKKRVKS